VGGPDTAPPRCFRRPGHPTVRRADHRDDDRRHRPGSWPIRGRRPVAVASEDLPQLATAADTRGSQIAPLTYTPVDALSATSTVLSVLKPATVVNHVVGVATGVRRSRRSRHPPQAHGVAAEGRRARRPRRAPGGEGAEQPTLTVGEDGRGRGSVLGVADTVGHPGPPGTIDRRTRSVDPGRRRRHPIGHPGRANPGNRLDQQKRLASVAARRRADPASLAEHRVQPRGGRLVRHRSGRVGTVTVSGHRTGTTASMRWSPT